MQAAAGIVAGNAGKAEAFGDDALAGEGGVAVEQHRQHAVAVRTGVPDNPVLRGALHVGLARTRDEVFDTIQSTQAAART